MPSQEEGQSSDRTQKTSTKLARPDDVVFSAEVPKIRSGKIMRRLPRDIAEGRALGDTTTLSDPAAVASLKAKNAEE